MLLQFTALFEALCAMALLSILLLACVTLWYIKVWVGVRNMLIDHAQELLLIVIDFIHHQGTLDWVWFQSDRFNLRKRPVLVGNRLIH